MTNALSMDKALAAACSHPSLGLRWDDLCVACTCLLGYTPTKFELASMFGDAVMQADRLPISQSQFKQVMATRMSKIDPDETIRQIFLLLDTESKGYINQEDLGNGLKKCIPHHSQSLEVGSILSKHITSNQSGFNVKITYRQFRQIIATFTQSKYSDIKV